MRCRMLHAVCCAVATGGRQVKCLATACSSVFAISGAGLLGSWVAGNIIFLLTLIEGKKLVSPASFLM